MQRLVDIGAGDEVVVVRADHHFDIGDHIALCIAANPGGDPIEIDRNRRDRAGVGDRVGARPAIEAVRTDPADQRIVARAAQQRFIGAGPDQAVVEGRTDHPLDAQQLVARRGAAGPDAAVEEDADRRARVRIVGKVVAGAAVQRIGSQPAAQGIVADAPRQRIGIAIADQRIRRIRADHVLDVEIDIALRIAAAAGASRKVDRYRGGRPGIGDGVDAKAAVDGIGAKVALESVVAGIAVEVIVARAAPQGIVVATAVERLDIGQLVAGGIARGARRAVQPDRYRARHPPVAHRILTRPAIDGVGAIAAVEDLVGGRTGDLVGIVGHVDVVEVRNQIARRIAADARRHPVEHDGDARRGGADVGEGVIGAPEQGVVPRPAVEHIRARAAADHVVARATQQGIVARPAQQNVVARPAGQQVGIAIAGQDVVERGAGHVLDIDQRIALRVAAGAGAGVEIDRDPDRAGAVVDQIGACPAVHIVRASPAHEGVVAVAAIEEITARAAVDHVVAVQPLNGVLSRIAAQGIVEVRARKVGDVEQHVARRIADGASAGGKADRDRTGRAEVSDGVDVRPAVDGVGPGPAVDGVVAGLAIKDVVARAARNHIEPVAAVDDIGQRIAGESVVVVRADQVLDARIAVACRIADRAATRQVGRNRRQRIVIRRIIVARAADQGIRPRAADQRIIARAAIDDVRRRTAHEEVGIGRADQVLDRIADEQIARRIAARAGNGIVERDGDAGRAARIVRRVDPRAADQRIGPRATDQRVVARPAIERIVARAARQAVIAKAAINRVGIAGADENVVEIGEIVDLDIGQHIARGIAGRAARGQHIEGKASGGGGIVDRVDPRPAVDRIGPRTGRDPVVAATGQNGVAIGRAIDIVGQRRAQHFLDIDQHVAIGVARGARRAIHIDHDPARGRIVGNVEARPAIEQVGPAAANQRIVACTAQQRLVEAGADQAVVEGRTGHHLDIGDDIARRVAAAADAAIEVDVDSGAAGRIVDRIDAKPAVDGVGRRARNEAVVAAPAVEHRAGGRPAAQRIGKGRTLDLLDILQGIALRPAAHARRAIVGNAHAGIRQAIVDNVETRAAIDLIRAEARDDHIVAGAALQGIGPRAAGQAVVARPAQLKHAIVVAGDPVVLVRADHFLDVEQAVARSIAAGAVGAVHVDVHAAGGAGRIINHVETRPAVVDVGPGA